MAIGLSIKADIDKATRWMMKIHKKQIPFATSLALNRTAVKVQKVEKARMVQDLDRPTRQTVNSVRVKRSNKRMLRSEVFLLPWSHAFLKYQIHGGTRAPRGITEAVPVSMRLNKFGNITGRRQGKLGKILNQPDKFSGTINGVAGIWQRGRGKQRNKKVKLLVAYEQVVSYRPRFPFYKYAVQTVNRTWRAQFRRAMRQAIRG